MERALVLADLDVEEPNDHILLNTKLENEEPVTIMLPRIDYSRCIKCGVCGEVCDTGAIVAPKGRLPFVIPRLCSGCRACYFACPVKAISEGLRVIGHTYHTRVKLGTTSFDLITGVLREGEEHTPPVVIAAKKRALSIPRDLVIIDTSAGTANHVSIAIKDSDIALVVTEPTPLGLHDLEMILELTSTLGIESWVLVNRYGIGGSAKFLDKLKEVVSSFKTKIVALIPYSHEVIHSYVKGLPLVIMHPDHEVSKVLRYVSNLINEVI